MEEILLGTVDRTILVFVPDPASTDGSGKTGLVAANLTVSYTRVESDNDVVISDVTSSLSNLSALTDAHADWGLKEVSSTLAPGLYRLDIADAVFASGAWEAVVYVMITSSAAAATPKAFKLVNFDMQGQSAIDLKDFADDGYDPSTNKVQGVVLVDTLTTYTGNTVQTGDSFARIGATGSGLTTLASAANLATVAGYLDTEIAAILADTNELQVDWANGGRLDLILDARSSQTSVDTIDGIVDAIVVDTGTTLQGELDGIQAVLPATTNLRTMMDGALVLTVDDATFSPTTTVFETTLATNADRFTNPNQVGYWLTGNNAGESFEITVYEYSANSKVKLTIDEQRVAPANGEKFIVSGVIK